MKGSATTLEYATAAVLMAGIFLYTSWLLHAAWAFTTDDAYITLRYARHLSERQGLLWNVGEPPVEGYSNFLFVLLGALSLRAGIEPILVFKLLCAGSLFGTLACLYLLARSWCGPIASTLPPLALVSYRGTPTWTVSGLETAFYQFIVILGVVMFFLGTGYRFRSPAPVPAAAREPPSPRLLFLAGLLIGLASLTRPEGPLVALVMSSTLWFSRSRLAAAGVYGQRKALACFVGGFTLLFLPYSIWRIGYFTRLLPNAVYCKAEYLLAPFSLLGGFWRDSKYFIFLSLLQSPRKLDARHAILFGVPAAYAIIMIGVDPIIGEWNRHFLTAIALLLVPAVAGSSNIARLAMPRLSRATRETALAVLLVVITALSTRSMYSTITQHVQLYSRLMITRREVGEWLNHALDPDQYFAVNDAGLISYVARARAIDCLCLNSLAATSSAIDRDPFRFIGWLLRQEPEIILLPSAATDRLAGMAAPIASIWAFRTRYQLVRVFETPRQPRAYHYFAYRLKAPAGRLPRV